MNSLLDLLKRLYNHLIFLVLLALSLSLYFKSSYYQKAKISAATRIITGTWYKQVSKVTDLFNLRRENTELLNENLELRNQIEGYKFMLRELVDTIVTQNDSLNFIEYIPSNVINNSISSQHNYLILDVGENKGVKSGMGVVSNSGVVGVVASVSSHYSSVISLLNTDLQISAMHKKSGAFGSLSWDGANYRKVILNEIPLHINISKGDTIVSSGYSAIFPKDIPIGKVVDFHSKDGSFLAITVELFAEFKTISKVYVIRSRVKEEIDSLQQNVD